MSQSLYTAMGGVSAAQTSLNVISNNIANINTVAFKSSSTNFSEVYSSTISSGSAASGNAGGTNPKQVGLGVQVSSISRNFNSGTWVATGQTTDLMIEGDGFFTATTADGQKLYTRAGNFSFDSAGNLVTASGYKILGTNSLLSATGSSTPIYIPQRISTKTQANSTAWSQPLTSLNNCSLTNGDFKILANGTGALTLNVNTTANTTMGAIATSLQNQIDAASDIVATCTAQANAANTASTSITGLGTTNPMTAPIRTQVTTAATNALTAARTALSGGVITQAQYDTINNAINDSTTGILANLPAVNNNLTAAQITNITAAETAINTTLNTMAADPAVAAWANQFNNITATCNATTGGTIQFGVSGAVTSLKFAATTTNQSNFINATGLNSATLSSNRYTSNVLDYTVNVTQVTSIDDSTSISSYSIGDDGSIVATYKNGDSLTATLSSNGNTYEFKYVTSDNVKITGTKVNMDPNVAQVGNFVLQLASITNNEGLLSVGNNLYSAGPNCGDVIYSVGNQMGLGDIASGGYEASNVDLSEQFSNMILAQRAVQANSRVFSTTSNIMDVIVQMGR